jgi:hypothetical protein
MALKPCRECGQQVSTDAETCPHCGVRSPTDRAAAGKRTAGVVSWLVVLGIIAWIWSALGTSKTPPNQNEGTAKQEDNSNHVEKKTPPNQNEGTAKQEAADMKTMKYDSPGCKSREDATKFLRLIVAKDLEAASKFINFRIVSGDCRLFKAGTQLYVADRALFSDAICMRKTGDFECYWINGGMMTP